MKYLLMLDTPFWLLLSGGLTTYVFALKRRIRGLNDPRLYLSKGERRAWARKELAQREEDHDLAQLEKNTRIIKGDIA